LKRSIETGAVGGGQLSVHPSRPADELCFAKVLRACHAAFPLSATTFTLLPEIIKAS
jgi:hypothetical protein